MDFNAVPRAGARLLGEVEETSLDEVLHALRRTIPATTTAAATAREDRTAPGNAPASRRLRAFPIAALNDLLGRHFHATREMTLSVSGSFLPFLYALIATLILPPHCKAVVVIDTGRAFSSIGLAGCAPVSSPTEAPAELVEPAELPSLPSLPPHPTARVGRLDLDHVHIYQPPWDANIADVMTEAERFMLYGNHASKGREWWGTFVINEAPIFARDSVMLPPTSALSSRPIVHVGSRGWLRIEKQPASPPLNLELPAKELPAEVARYNAEVSRTGWLASSEWGGFLFRLKSGKD
ncbi:hypothetical protein GQ53DRAFT_749486 [Thozetella sp. PMI_491]|nr:hypothetical protein GQ53DRAFT_749486 [Thozetella sp. PMI_491]